MNLKLIFLIFLIKNFYTESFCEDIIDLSCTTDLDCIQLISNDYKVKCLNETCICEAKGEEVECRPSVVNLSNLIRHNCPCNTANSFCDERRNMCLCKKEFTASADRKRCIKKSLEIGQDCENNDQCSHNDPFTKCDEKLKVCVCMENFTNYRKKCYSLIGSHSRCFVNWQCRYRARHSICGGGKCFCEDNYIADKNNSICLKASGYDEACTESAQCKAILGAGSECEDGFCVCNSIYYLNMEKHRCEKFIFIGDYCSVNEDCHINGVKHQTMYCKAGECHCYDNSRVNGTICPPSGKTAVTPLSILYFLGITLLTVLGG